MNIKGCTLSQHSNVKPPEPEKSEKQEDIADILEHKIPTPLEANTRKPRPDFDSLLKTMTATIASTLQQAMLSKILLLQISVEKKENMLVTTFFQRKRAKRPSLGLALELT